MKSNKIFWKCVSDTGAKKILRVLSDRYLRIRLVYRKNNQTRTLRQFNEGMQYMELEGVEKQIEFVENNPIVGMNQFYIIETV